MPGGLVSRCNVEVLKVRLWDELPHKVQEIIESETIKSLPIILLTGINQELRPNGVRLYTNFTAVP